MSCSEAPVAVIFALVHAFAMSPSPVATGASSLATLLLWKVSVYLHLNMEAGVWWRGGDVREKSEGGKIKRGNLFLGP